jgi:hypothetical protein
MTGRIVMLTLALSGLYCTAAIAGSPPNPGGGGQAIAGTTAIARAVDSANGIPGASSWGGARAATGQGEIPGVTNHDVNTIAKGLNGGDPTHGKP